jgi:hypothetical protein
MILHNCKVVWTLSDPLYVDQVACNTPLCGADDETSVHILCECEALAWFRHAYLGSFFLEPENIKNISLGAIWNFSKVAGLPWETTGAQRARSLSPRCIGAVGPLTWTLSIYLHVTH